MTAPYFPLPTGDEPTQETAWAAGADRVPEEIIAEVYEATNDERLTGWPTFYDRTGEVWRETGERHDGDVVMMPGSDWVPMLRRDVQTFWGPLVTEELHNEWTAAVNRRMALTHAASEEPDACAHCGLEIEDRGEVDADGKDEVRWVHAASGRSSCIPSLGGASLRATPTTPGCCYNAEAAEQAMWQESLSQ